MEGMNKKKIRPKSATKISVRGSGRKARVLKVVVDLPLKTFKQEC